jgi:quercetin dioxygenase-like cupin family protein
VTSASTGTRAKRSIYVLEGSLEHQIDGKAPVTLKASGVLFIPAGRIHWYRQGAEFDTYIFEKGKPLVVLSR